MIRVIDEFLPVSLATKLLEEVEDFGFPWYYKKNNAPRSMAQKITYAKCPLLIHTLYLNSTPTSQWFNIFNTILYFIEDRFNVNILNIERIKINCVLRTETPILYTPHADTEMQGYTTFVYYLNTSDGYTNIYNERKECNDNGLQDTDSLTLIKQIQPVHNSILRFDSNQYHSYLSPTDCDRRLIVNMVVRLQ
jgi:hypothetical protein